MHMNLSNYLFRTDLYCKLYTPEKYCGNHGKNHVWGYGRTMRWHHGTTMQLTMVTTMVTVVTTISWP